MRVEWIDHGREPQCEPNPEYPNGIDFDGTNGEGKSCTVDLPYPASRCGVYHVICEKCGMRVMITTAGRPDDPRSLKMPCKETL